MRRRSGREGEKSSLERRSAWTAPRLSGPTTTSSTAVGERTVPQLRCWIVSGLCAVGEQSADPHVAAAPERVEEDAGRGGVEPLEVVDRDENGSALGERAQAGQERGRNGAVARRLSRLEEQGGGQRSTLRLRQRREDDVQNSVEQVRDPCERQRGLRFGRSGAKDEPPLRFGEIRTCKPERRLPGAGFAAEHEARGAAEVREKRTDVLELSLASDDLAANGLLDHQGSMNAVSARGVKPCRHLRRQESAVSAR